VELTKAVLDCMQSLRRQIREEQALDIRLSQPDAIQQMLKACLTASQFKNAHARGKPAEFDDQAGMSALLIEGVYPQKHMQQRTGTELCLYDRQHQRAFVSEWSPEAK